MSLSWIGAAAHVNYDPITGLVELGGYLYGVSYYGHLFRWNGVDAWTKVAERYDVNESCSYGAITVFNGEIFVGTSYNGYLLKWNGSNAYDLVAPKYNTNVTKIHYLKVFNNELYAGTGNVNCNILKWNGSNAWTYVSSRISGTADVSVRSLVVFNNKLYGNCFPSGKLGELSGSTLLDKGTLSDSPVDAACVHNNKLYAATSYDYGLLYEWNGTDTFVQKAGQYGTEGQIYGLVSHDGNLYGSTGNGRLLKWNGTDAWTLEADTLGTNCTVYCLCTFSVDGKLYGGSDQVDGYTLFYAGTPPILGGLNAEVEILADGIGGETEIVGSSLTVTTSIFATVDTAIYITETFPNLTTTLAGTAACFDVSLHSQVNDLVLLKAVVYAGSGSLEVDWGIQGYGGAECALDVDWSIAATGAVSNTGVAAIALTAGVLSISGGASGSIEVPAAILAATGITELLGAVSLLHRAYTINATGRVEQVGTASLQINAAVITAIGVPEYSGIATVTIGAATLGITGTPGSFGVAVLDMNWELTATGIGGVFGTAAITLPAAIINALSAGTTQAHLLYNRWRQ
jgi:hypothetical protein